MSGRLYILFYNIKKILSMKSFKIDFIAHSGLDILFSTDVKKWPGWFYYTFSGNSV